MDGNGRWAKSRGLHRIEGHREGVKNVKVALEVANTHQIQYLTLYAFSVENWKRPKEEVDALMGLLVDFLEEQKQHLFERKIRLRTIGRQEGLPNAVCQSLAKVCAETAMSTEHQLILALNYGGRTEVLDAVQHYGEDLLAGKVPQGSLSWEQFREYLYTKSIPDPDLIIRTSGESRLSNFLLLQSAYAEIYTSPVCWPDFGEEEFEKALVSFQTRERRFGKTSEQIAGLK